MGSLLFFLIGIFLVFIVGKLLLIPMKIIIKLIGNGILGGITLLIFNLVGGLFNLSIDITPLNAILSGFLGVPGVILLLLLQ